MEHLVAGAIIWIICGMIGGGITAGRGRGFGSGFLVGVLFGPFGVLIAVVLASQPPGPKVRPAQLAKPEVRRPCPYCGEMILPDAKVCRSCGRDVEPLQAPAAPAAVAPYPVGTGFVRCGACNAKNYAYADRCEKCGVAFLEPAKRM